MKIVAVTSCATGIAHSYMAAEAIAKVAKKAGYGVRVEIQGAMGLENKLTQAQIDDADVVVLANDVGLVEPGRFDSSTAKTVQIRPHDVITHPERVIESARRITGEAS
ncbi:MAG TPA: PTS fructose transporter subunit IIB [Cellulomonas sp.]